MTRGPQLAALLVIATVVSTSSALAAGGITTPFRVGSTLDGKTTLPHRIHWTAHPTLPASRLNRVDFLIDGKVRWIEANPPYTYGDDGNWLVTSWLSPGRHRFTVRARAMNGTTAQRTTIANVVASPPPPAALAGRWQRTVTPEEAGSGTPFGTWVLTVDSVGWKIRDPLSTGNVIDVAYVSDGRIEARGGIYTRPRNDYEGNGWCPDTNAPVDYRWAVSANTLTLTLDGPDLCGEPAENQHLVWAGAWTRLA